MQMRVNSTISIFALMSILTLITYCSAEVWTTAYYADGITPVLLRDPNIPNIYVDVMVGTHLSMVVSSDANTIAWNGHLTIEAPDAGKGQLRPCGFDEFTYSYTESCSILPAAQSVSGMGRPPRIGFMDSPVGDHFIYMQGAHEPNTGEWFAVDYHAFGLGECRVLFTEFPAIVSPVERENPTDIEPVFSLVNVSTFTHAQTRDFDDNAVVDFKDFASMAQHLQDSESSHPNMPIDPNDFAAEYDFNHNKSIDVTDLSMFMDYWLRRTR